MEKHPQTKAAQEFLAKLDTLSRTSPPSASLKVMVDGNHLLSLAPEQKMRMMSTQKCFVNLAYAREVAKHPELAQTRIPIGEVDAVNTGIFDGGTHAAWKARMGNTQKVSLEQIAEGMMQESSNTCTQYLMNHFGVDKINAIMAETGVAAERFGATFDITQACKTASADDMVKLMEFIANEPTPVQTCYRRINPFKLLSPAGEANGIVKDGAGILPGKNGMEYDLNAVWHTTANDGSRVSAAFFTNGIDAATNKELEEKMLPFIAEISCNASARGHWKRNFSPRTVLNEGAEIGSLIMHHFI